MRENVKRLGEQGVAAQDRHALAKNLVAGGPAAAQVVVVHAGQVVVHQRIGVQDFHRAGRGHGLHGIAATGFGGGKAEDRTQTFASGENGVAHRLVNGLRGTLQRWQKIIQGAIHRCRHRGQILGEV